MLFSFSVFLVKLVIAVVVVVVVVVVNESAKEDAPGHMDLSWV